MRHAGSLNIASWRAHKSAVLQLAYEEYCLRRQAGESVDVDAYCERFPTHRRSLRRLLSVHRCLDEDPELAELTGEGHWPDLGTDFLGFRLVGELGRGAFARVFLATEPSLGDRPVVLKISPMGGGEAETLGRLAHRNIVPVHSVQRDPHTGLTAVCMPYLGGATLLNVLDAAFASGTPPRSAKLIPQVASQEAILEAIPEMYLADEPRLAHGTYVDGIVHLMAQLADALDHAHGCGVCHRDLKPSNILLTPSGCPMLLDFNLSSDIRSANHLIGGTLLYMAPEHLRQLCLEDHQTPIAGDCDPGLFGDPRGDIFALGVILYESLTGSLPFGDPGSDENTEMTAAELLERHQQGYVAVRALNRHVNRSLAAVVDRCLHWAPDQRPDSAAQLGSALRAQLTPAAQLVRWAQRRMLLVGAGSAGLTLIGGGVVAAVALRPAPAVRHYRAGELAFALGDFAAAAEHFTSAHEARPLSVIPLLARGQAWIALEDFTAAAADFRLVYETAPDGPSAAWLAYALHRDGYHIAAAAYYQKAEEQHNHQTVDVWNNLGYIARLRHSLSHSADYFTRAIELDPSCQQAYHNRASAYSALGSGTAASGVPYHQLAVADIERAVALGSDDGALMFDAALMHWRYAQTAESRETVVDYLRRALDLGLDRTLLLRNTELDPELLAQVADHPAGTTTVSRRPLSVAPPYSFPPLESR
jgi:eukaryotic-like serine/threonine-protein kinase